MAKPFAFWVEEVESQPSAEGTERSLLLGGVARTGQQGFLEIDLEKLIDKRHRHQLPRNLEDLSVVATATEVDRPARNAFLIVGIFKKSGTWPLLRFQSVNGAATLADVRFSWQCYAPLMATK